MKSFKNIFIIAGGHVSPAFLKREIEKEVEQNGSPLVLAADGGLEVLRELGIVPDLMIGDFDSASKDTAAYFRSLCVEEIKLNPIKDDTDMEAAISLCMSRFQKVPIVIFGATGTRLDHVLANIGLLSMGLGADGENTPVTILDEHNKIYLLTPDKDVIIRKDAQHGKYFSLLNYSDRVSGLRICGSAYNVGDENSGIELVRSKSLGVSNEVKEEKAVISIEEGILIVDESID